MKSHIKGRVFWVGTTEWDDHLPGQGAIRHFHKSESYNSYLILAGHSVLVDTVAQHFADEYIENLSREIPLCDLHGIILSCGEKDHIGALPRIVEENPHIRIYAAESEIPKVRKTLNRHARIIPVHSGDHLDEEDFSIEFYEIEPFRGRKSLFSYIKEEKVLFSGYATEYLLKDLTDGRIHGKDTHGTPVGKLLRSRLEEKIGDGIRPDVVCTNHGTPMYMF
ncbi:MAG: hypothetical protein JXB03_03850 [Spirochaetales bacterium]|nr:hypothetical protein [Spirochaetales bacterium]